MSRSNLSGHPAAVSFTVRRPSPLSRETSDPALNGSFKAPAPPSGNAVSAPSPLSKSSTARRNGGGRGKAVRHFGDDEPDSSDDDDARTEDEIITGFDSLGVQRAFERPPTGPLVIPAIPNRDWRAEAKRRQSQNVFVPESARAAVSTGADGSVGGLGTKDTINSGPQQSGLIQRKKREDENVGEDATSEDVEMAAAAPEADSVESAPSVPMTDDERALQALLKGDKPNIPTIDAIPISSASTPRTEADAYAEDILTRPESSTLDDYERVPIDQFGAALLRGMGWKEGMAASKTRKGPVEPYVPKSRPALLGIGAKERAADDVPASGSGGKGGKQQRPEKRYVPVVKRARDGSIVVDDSKTLQSSSRSTPSSRRQSQSPPRRERDRDRERDGYSSSTSSRPRDDRDRDRPRDDRDRDRDRRRDDDSSRTRDRDRSSYRDEYRSSRDGNGTSSRSGGVRDRDRDSRRSGGDRSSARDDYDRDRYRSSRH